MQRDLVSTVRNIVSDGMYTTYLGFEMKRDHVWEAKEGCRKFLRDRGKIFSVKSSLKVKRSRFTLK